MIDLFSEAARPCRQIPGVLSRMGKDFHEVSQQECCPRTETRSKDEDWERINDMLPGQPVVSGVIANFFFFFFFFKKKKNVADLPERFGPWGSVWKRFDRWAKKGVWARAFEALQGLDLERMILDSTVVRAHRHAAGAEKGGRRRPGVGPFGGGIRHPNPHPWLTPWATPWGSS